VIRVRGLRKQYPGGPVALNGVDLDIAEGELVALIGPSGAGKSTLLRCLNGFVTPTAGEVEVGGASVTGATGERLRLIRAGIGFVFQQFNLQRRLSVRGNVLIGGLARAPRLRSLLGLFPATELARARAALARVGLDGLDDRRVDTLSGGQQQRVAIARVLVQEPRVVLADEPMASLDPALSETVLAQLQRISDEDGITVVTSLHVLDLARRYSRRVIGLRGGRVAYDGSPQDLTETAARRIFADTAA
jgi:phosphonate transport system ATP-binding protein